MKKWTKVFDSKPSEEDIKSAIKEAENHGKYVRHILESGYNEGKLVYLLDIRIED